MQDNKDVGTDECRFVSGMEWVVSKFHVGLIASLLVLTSVADAQSGLDPRSMGMGGVGIAVANPSTASFFNPAVLSLAAKNRFSVEFPSFGGFISDPGDFDDTLKSLDDQGFIANLESSVSDFNSLPSNAGVDLVVNSANQLDGGFAALSRYPADALALFGASVGSTDDAVGWNLYATSSVGAFISVDYADSAFLTGFADALDQVNFDDPSSNSVALLEGLSEYINYIPDGMGGVAEISLVPFDVSDMDTQIEAMWFSKEEVGVSLSTILEGICVGVTTKKVDIEVTDLSFDPDTVTVSDPDDYFSRYEDFNFDVGVALEDDDGWTYGAVVRNVLDKKYLAYRESLITGLPEATGRFVEFSPTIHVGAAREVDWGTVAVDVDLMKTRFLSGANDNQYLSAGVEYDLKGWAQLRGGCRLSLIDADRSVLSAGLGLSPFGLHVDAAIIGNSEDIGGAVQVGFRF